MCSDNYNAGDGDNVDSNNDCINNNNIYNNDHREICDSWNDYSSCYGDFDIDGVMLVMMIGIMIARMLSLITV